MTFDLVQDSGGACWVASSRWKLTIRNELYPGLWVVVVWLSTAHASSCIFILSIGFEFVRVVYGMYDAGVLQY